MERQIFNTRVKFELVILINTLLYVVNFSLLLVDMFHQLQDTCGHKGLCCKTLKDIIRIIVVFYFKNIFVWFETGYQGSIRLFQKGFQCIIKALLPDLFASFHFLLHLQSEVASGERKTFHWELHWECRSPLIVLCWLVVWQRRWCGTYVLRSVNSGKCVLNGARGRMHGQKKGWTLWSWCIFNWMLMGSVSERRLVLINQGGVQKKDSVLKPSSNLAIGGYRGKRCQMPWVLLMKKKTHWQFSGTASFVKNADFVCCYGEIIRRPAAASILMPATFHIAFP